MNNTFSIRVTNDARKTKFSSWTKTVTLKLGQVKVNLGQKKRVKVDGHRIQLPYNKNSLYITKADNLINVTTNIGIQLLWDGVHFLQVQASATYKEKLCGLCGNYNKIIRDDLKSRKGFNYTDNNVWSFANSWKVGGTKACARKDENFTRNPICRPKNKYWHICKQLNETNLFGNCDTRLNPSNYIESCKKDMCECPNGKCYCESFAAYAHECKRVGAELSTHWQSATLCDVQSKFTMRRHKKRTNNRQTGFNSKKQQQIPKNSTKINKLSDLPIN